MLHPIDLPDFPWDSLLPYREVAEEHPGGVCDLSVGTPVDSTPEHIQRSLLAVSDAHGYPKVVGTDELRKAIISWSVRRNMIPLSMDSVLPTIGSKEAVALLPLMIGVRPGDTILIPEIAYPTYEIGARIVGARAVPVDSTKPETWPDASLVWLNSPANPHGQVLSKEELRSAILWARSRGTVIASDECYSALPWSEPFISEGIPSLLDTQVCDGNPENLITLYSLSKQSNMAGYRTAMMLGDPELIQAITLVRRHSGFILPAPMQKAMATALADDAHVHAQRSIYGNRRRKLLEAIQSTDLVNDERCIAGLYLWVRDSNSRLHAWDLVDRFARAGIVVAPGTFYGNAGKDCVRVGLTASDERITAAAERIRAGLTPYSN